MSSVKKDSINKLSTASRTATLPRAGLRHQPDGQGLLRPAAGRGSSRAMACSNRVRSSQEGWSAKLHGRPHQKKKKKRKNHNQKTRKNKNE